MIYKFNIGDIVNCDSKRMLITGIYGDNYEYKMDGDDKVWRVPTAVLDMKGESADDNINHPARYTKGKIECIDAVESATAGLEGIEAFCTGNGIKYLWRWKDKEQVDSLKKAVWYINHLIEHLEKKQ